MKTNQMGKAESMYIERAITRESGTVTCIWQTQRQAEEWENRGVEKRRFQVCVTGKLELG